MKELKFKTNIQCGNCLSKVSPFLNQENSISQWEVDLSHADKLLSVKTDTLSAQEVSAVVQKSGFTAEAVS